MKNIKLLKETFSRLRKKFERNSVIKESLTYKTDSLEDSYTIEGYLDGDLVGSVTFEIIYNGYKYEFYDIIPEDLYDKIFGGDPLVHIVDLNVDDYYQNSGFGTQLFIKALNKIKELGLTKMYLNANPKGYGLNLSSLVEFYKKFGFKILKDQGSNVIMYKTE